MHFSAEQVSNLHRLAPEIILCLFGIVIMLLDPFLGRARQRALGWVAFIVFGTLYYLTPRMWGRPAMWSTRLIGWHYWIATIGIVLYITAMWVSGIMQGLMWRAYDELGFLQYSFVETVAAMHPFYLIRLLGGVFFLSGGLIMAYNMWRTVRGEPEAAADATRQPVAA